MHAKSYLPQIVIIFTLIAIHIYMLSANHATLICLMAGGLLMGTAIILRRWDLLHYALLLILIYSYPIFLLPKIALPVLPLLVPFLLSTLFILPIMPARKTLVWLRTDTIDYTTFVLMLMSILLAGIALIIWGLWSDQLGVGMKIMQNFAVPHWLMLCVLLPLFALTNGFAEEAVYRGVMQNAFQSVFNYPVSAILLQASAFGAAHYTYGFPNGKIGYSMTFVYGCALGYLRNKTHNIFAPWITHVAADLVIGYFLYWYVVTQSAV